MTTLVLIVIALVALLVAQFVYYVVVYQGERRQAELKRRLQSLTAHAGDGDSVLRERRIAHTAIGERLLGDLPLARRIEGLLLQTDLDWTVARVLFLTVAGFAGGLVGLWLITGSLLMGLLTGLVAASLPIFAVFNSRAKRSTKLSGQLPDALDMMVRSLRAGHGVTAAMRLVAEEMPLPVAMEFGRCFEEQRLGVGLKEAVRNMAARVPSNMDLKIFAVSVIIQHDTGGNLVEILEQISGTIRERFKFYGKLRALTVEAKMSGIVLSILPFLSAVLVAIFNPEYLRPLVDDPLGRALMFAGLALWGVGVIWMRRLARVDY
jgi:tight adherence protein B